MFFAFCFGRLGLLGESGTREWGWGGRGGLPCVWVVVRDPHRKLHALFILRNFCCVMVGTATSNRRPSPRRLLSLTSKTSTQHRCQIRMYPVKDGPPPKGRSSFFY